LQIFTFRLIRVVKIMVESIIPEVGTCDMAGWLIAVELRKVDIAGCTEFTVDWR